MSAEEDRYKFAIVYAATAAAYASALAVVANLPHVRLGKVYRLDVAREIALQRDATLAQMENAARAAGVTIASRLESSPLRPGEQVKPSEGTE